MRVLLVGGHGFLGWHLACRSWATRGLEVTRVGRETTADPGALVAAVAAHDVVVHLAAVNRHPDPCQVRDGTLAAARATAAAVRAAGRPGRVVHAGSVRAGDGTRYGDAKAAAWSLLDEASSAVGGSCGEVTLPHLFGEHGRPHHQSFVATFCHQVLAGQEPTVTEDRELELMHAQHAAELLLREAEGRRSEVVRPSGLPVGVGDVAGMLTGMAAAYAAGELPGAQAPLQRDLFNTLRSHVEPHVHPVPHHLDPRGGLVELSRSRGGASQAFLSTTRPGRTRGDHVHLHRFERFLVVSGRAEIRLRRLYDDRVLRFRVDGETPAWVDMPTLWAHSITNTGDGELVTAFWSDQLLDAEDPDQFPVAVLPPSAAGAEPVLAEGARR